MLVGILADTHDNLPKVSAAMKLFAERGVGTILHAGDFVAPFVLRLMGQGGVPIIGVFGNNDGERAGLSRACDGLHAAPYRCVLGGRTIVLAHDADQLAGASDGADLLVCGHTHEPRVQMGPPLLVNPGEAGGWLTGLSTAALVSLETMEAELVQLGPQETVLP